MTTIARAAFELCAGTTTAEEIAEACLAKANDPAGEGARAFIKLDAKKILAQARASDALRKHKIVPSPLAGITVSVKDLFDVQGEVTTAGSKALADRPPATKDATAVARLRAAGAILFGRSNMTEFGYSGIGMNPHYGTPACPWDRKARRIAGGSSSGAAVSVSDGMAIVGLGADTSGSCRVPAALCGTVGYKPTAWRIPTQGTTPLSFSLDSVGSFANSVGCVALIDQIMAGESVRALDPIVIKNCQLAVPNNVALDNLDRPTATAFGRVLTALGKAGAVITDIAIQTLARLPEMSEKGGLIAGEASAWHRDLVKAHGRLYDPRVRSRIELGLTQSTAEYLNLLEVRRDLIKAFDTATRGYDAVLMPTTPVVAPPMSAFDKDDEFLRLNRLLLRNTMIANLMDRCSISIPCHFPGDAPVGLMLIGGHDADHALLSLAAAIESLLVTQDSA